MKRPTKITPDPIIDAVVELRYESKVPPDAILGMIFAQVNSKYSDFKNLPITAIPEDIRRNDPNLWFNPYYQAEAPPFKLNIGPRVISLSNTGNYSGWKEKYFPELKDLLENIKKSGVVDSFSRVGVRYIDFFEFDIYDHINLSITLNNKPLDSVQSVFTAIFNNDGCSTRAQVVNNATVVLSGKEKVGSIIDTDTFFEPQDRFYFDGLNDLIDKCHDEALDFFFKLLKKEFVETLNPEY
ncbi:TIGR04255 family protein [Desulfobulbus sp.]|uniref:TIGR04255 family protein n=1 Tax=Desulfobulbus sp. TaxID=895 RepID=UPI00286FA39C|nr:TIGR04255 family protein [Desulfobulbus sp.]